MRPTCVSSLEIQEFLDQATANRPVIIYCFEEGMPSHSVLEPTFVEVSRKAGLGCHFLTINSDDVDSKLMATLHISSFPSFVIHKGSSTKSSCFSVQTKERLIDHMVKAGIIGERQVQ